MPAGTCDPQTRGELFNVSQLAVGNGDVVALVRFGWDNRSTRDARTHTTAAGDTLASIATLYSATEAELQAWNNLPDTSVTVGQVLIVWPGGCDGPLINGTGPGSNRWAISYTNASQTTYYMHTTGRNGQQRTLTIAPGANGTISAAQAASQGYVNLSDCLELTLTTTP